jgi:hypothetical protein
MVFFTSNIYQNKTPKKMELGSGKTCVHIGGQGKYQKKVKGGIADMPVRKKCTLC